MNKSEIQTQIAKWEKLKKSAGAADEKDFAQRKIDSLTKKLEESDDSKDEKIPAKEKKAAKKVETRGRTKGSKNKPSATPKEKVVVKKEVKKKMVVKDGDKEYTESDPDFCKILIKQMKQRKAAIEKAGKKYKSVSISTKIGTDIAHAVEKAIDSVDKQKIKDKPTVFVAKFEKLEKSGTQFLSDFRSILGEEYDSEDIKKPMEEISKLVDSIKSKYAKK